ncbi:S24 family peptidase [Ralstonia solanacearum]|uniref:helix-turn-helix domain-containing protein n=1 Tax=Ralstonia solanacearum TaxID=305 RepID=UPI0009BA3EA3|nr:helix-turn-helix domain-containing protein [Ralstonia solanacearum]MBB6586097.1 helix-turn-helix domain-containing protein [Ralstonia solanacearum]MCL9842664.1 helix-turn-helix domain-containing protein [Ralstonia solanacearum]MDB0534788.1 helix-turn-helix domain-containing protein [Ralstonia solanacearum]MDB0539544.1 helix-turn-helix domain-containing protein [Ralstonia solanacearum]MDB0549381.1 helix-turn-helix domain-containing protein [Ralstonia solanacearum]
MAEEKLAATASDEGDNKPMMLTGRNLNYLMGRKHVDAATLSKEIGLGIATVNAMRRGVGNPTLSTLLGLARYFDVSLTELTETDLSRDPPPSSPAKTIPLIRLGEVNDFLDQKLGRMQTYTTEIEGSGNATYFAVLLNNDALAPLLTPGTILIVARGEEPCDGDIVLVRIGAHIPCLRRIFIDGDSCLFSSVSPDSEVPPAIYKNYEVIAIAIKAIKPI